MGSREDPMGRGTKSTGVRRRRGREGKDIKKTIILVNNADIFVLNLTLTVFSL